MKTSERISEYIDSQKEYFLRDIKTLVDIKSVRETAKDGMPFGQGPAKALQAAIDIAKTHGFETLNFENYAGEITLGQNPVLMLLAHLDVVDEGDGWTYSPYCLTQVGTKIYGRGTTDDKGAAICCIYALKAARELFGEPKNGVRLVLGCGEETGSEDMEYYFSKRETLAYTVSPDADYPVINLEKGRYAPDFYKNTENNGKKTIVSFDGGHTKNIVPRKAHAVVSGFTKDEIEEKAKQSEEKTAVKFYISQDCTNIKITAEGISSHAANPEKGNNASTALISLINTLDLDKNETTDSFKSLEKLFPHGETDGKSVNVKMQDEVSGELTLNFGVLSFCDGEIKGAVDLRCPLCANKENVCDEIKNALEKHGFSVSNDEMSPVHYVSEDSPVVKTALKVYEEYTGEKGTCLAIGGGTYVHEIDGGIAFGTTFPDTERNIHSADEFAEIDELLLSTKMYTAMIRELCY